MPIKYLETLVPQIFSYVTKRTKWQETNTKFNVDDFVLLKEDNMPPEQRI